jgi:NAD(P)-dependent dehydrogenase (short-subunit alcohol dehydrogenase family)
VPHSRCADQVAVVTGGSNDAASYPDGTLLDMQAAARDQVFGVNVTGAFMMIQYFARHCVERNADGASIISISSGSARSPRPGGAASSASKAALETMSKVLHGPGIAAPSDGHAGA